eukprot:m.130029 g.130029  ORF g.130029 m.130029 type:complete len:76 (+) comp14593_c0_seq3:1518-1745(+)
MALIPLLVLSMSTGTSLNPLHDRSSSSTAKISMFLIMFSIATTCLLRKHYNIIVLVRSVLSSSDISELAKRTQRL